MIGFLKRRKGDDYVTIEHHVHDDTPITFVPLGGKSWLLLIGEGAGVHTSLTSEDMPFILRLHEDLGDVIAQRAQVAAEVAGAGIVGDVA